jgi:hypothetical protein
MPLLEQPVEARGEEDSVAGLICAVPAVLTAPPPVTMFSTCVVLRAKAMTLVPSASVRRVEVTLAAPASEAEAVARP